jgi:hypothetical protein
LVTKSIRSKLASLVGVTLLASSLAIAASTGTAAADDVSGSATALPGISILGNTLLGTPACTGTGTPAGASDTCQVQPILDLQPLADVGALSQDVQVDTNGHVAACAGLIGEGGTLEIGGPEGCTANGGTGRGLEVLGVLPGITPAILGLNAAYATCSASATGATGAAAVVQGLTILGTPVGDVLDAPPNTDISVLGLANIRINTQTPIPGGLRVTALEVDVLGLLNLKVGEATCAVDDINNDRTAGVFDTAGDVTAPNGVTVQPNTRNALTVTFASGGDRNDATGVIRLGPNVAIDQQRGPVGGQFQTTLPNAGLPAGCVSTQNVTAPLDPRIVCTLGDLTGGVPVTRTIPVTLGDLPANGRFEASAQLFATTSNPAELVATGQGPVDNGGRGPVFGQGPLTPAEANNLSGTRYGLIQVAGEVQQNIFQVQSGSTLVIPELDNDLDLPENITGKLYLDLPNFVESVRYGAFACDIVDEDPVPADEVIASAYPFLPNAGNQKWDCGQATKPVNQARQLELDVADGTPANAAGVIGRAVVLRRALPPAAAVFAPPAVQENSFYSNLLIQVTDGPVEPDQDAVDVVLDVAPSSRPAPGGTFNYTARITNIGDGTDEIVALERRSRQNNGAFGPWTTVGDADCNVGTDLAVTASCLYTFSDDLTGQTGDTETFEVRARIGDSAPDSDPATAVIGNAHRLAVTKSVVDDDLPAPGGSFTYNVTITNDDDLFDGDVTITSVIDEISNATDRDLTTAAQNAGCTVLSEGESCAFQFSNTFNGVAGDVQDDRILVTGTAADGPATGESPWVRASIEGAVGPEGLVVDLTADPTSIPEPGGKTKFTLKATNTLPANGPDLEIRTLQVQYNPTVDAEDMDASTCEVGALLDPGETYTCTFTDDIVGNAHDSFTYTAHATAEDVAGNDYTAIPDPATIVLTDVLPRIRVDETVAPASAKTPGGEFTWKVTVTNESKASSDPVEILTLRNELTLDLEKEKDCLDNVLGEILDVGESVSCTFKTKVEGPDGKVATDIVVVTARDDEGNVVSDLGNAAVSLTAADAPATTTPPTVRQNLVKTGANSRTTAAAAMLFAGLGLVLTGGGMQQAPELALEGQRRRRRRR